MDKVLKILMLEDSTEDIFLIERELKLGGIDFTSSVVNERNEFKQSLYEIKPDVILADHSLPQFNSLEALKIYHQFRSESKIHIPFILITGSVSEEFAAQCIKSGVDDYILKDRLKRLPSAIRNAREKTRIENDRLRYLNEIFSNEAMMREAEQLAHFGSWQFDLQTKNHKWSDETYRILGYEPGGRQATFETFLDHIHPEEKQSIREAIDNTLFQQDSYPCEFRIIDRVGKMKHILSNILVKRNHERQPIQLLGFLLDITEQKKQTEALALRNKQLIKIAWIQSHEVRGPLARLMGLINILENHRSDENCISELLKPLLESAYELDSIVRKIVRNTESTGEIDTTQYFNEAITSSVFEEYHPVEKGEKILKQIVAQGLTSRENEILKLVAQGVRNKDIGERLFISVRTVETHKTHILSKLGLTNTAELIKYAIKHNIITID